MIVMTALAALTITVLYTHITTSNSSPPVPSPGSTEASFARDESLVGKLLKIAGAFAPCICNEEKDDEAAMKSSSQRRGEGGGAVGSEKNSIEQCILKLRTALETKAMQRSFENFQF